jgi:3-hydroxyisobutyrate dehydrogenase-like beta-hydroxyacid dehydrogenase
MHKIGFIGLGAMGKPMANNLLKKGVNLTVYDIRPEPMLELKQKGANTATSPKEVASCSDITITMLLASVHVEAAVLGKGGAIEGFKENTTLIDMSSIDPNTTRKIGRILKEKKVEFIDAPVARGVKAATDGTLAIYVGGNEATFQKCKDVLGMMGTDVSYVGELGCGEVVKLVNQSILSTTVAAIAEGMILGVKGGVDPEILLKELCKGSATSFALENHFRNFVMKGNFGENIFPVDYILKDLGIVLSTGKDLNVPLFVTSAANQMYEWARASGKSKNYFPVVIKLLEELTGVIVRNKTAPK